jgi:hypothetical protein
VKRDGEGKLDAREQERIEIHEVSPGRNLNRCVGA